MKIEIISHCWAGRHKHYAAGLAYQLSSLLLDDVGAYKITATVCCDPGDEATNNVLRRFGECESNSMLWIKVIRLNRRYLGRRSIGRNHAALTTAADLVWFADVDQCWYDGCLKKLAEIKWPEGAVMIHPREIMIHRDHATGDEDLNYALDHPGIVKIDGSRFVPKRYERAIGGVQIVRGDFARKYGYLDGDLKWQRPFDGPGFDACRGDLHYRKFCSKHGKVVGVDLPGMYRLRHTEAGHGRPASKKPIGDDGVEKF